MSLIKEIVKNLTEETINNNIEWKLSDNLFNSETQKYFESFSVDGETKFKVQIYMNDKFSLETRMTNFHIYNKGLVNGYKILMVSDFSEIEKLGQVIYDKYVKLNIPQKSEDDTYKSILSNIFSKQHKRDQRIDAILGDETLPEDKPKSIINRLFGN